VSDLPGEEALVERARSGDRSALGNLLQHHGPRLYRAVLLPRLGSEAAARDALSETYAKVCANITKFTWQAKGFYPWLRVIALNTALDQLRGRKRTLLWSPEDVQTELDATNTATPLDAKLSEAHDRAAAKEKVTKALEKINERYATAIRLRVLEERPREEVAATLDVTVATFDVVLHRALAALRKVLEASKEGGDR
jgi:RNA polymerase sigma-70 factor (ECF subfamily)